MEIPKKYSPQESEDHWYSYWTDNGYFHSTPDEREPYTVVIPPPNVTGVLHMGHMLNNTIQDVLVRRARMQGKNACWVPGTDHASIATEAKVVRRLREKGITKKDLSRDEFMEHAWEWTREHGGIILEQLKKLGASCDWDRTTFTLDEKYSESVIDTFIDLYEKGHIYRGLRMINWDPAAKTALSDEEVIYKEEQSKLYKVQYRVADTEDEWLTIATTRPETILGDTAICIHPEDERYTHLHGKEAIVPIMERRIPIILDEYVDMEFGTGCLKVTPAHDPNDYVLGEKHGLETIDIMHPDGRLNEQAGPYDGMDRFEVRKQIATDLKEKGHLLDIEEYANKVGYSERTDVIIEPRLSLQWWVSMKELSEPALKAVMDDTVAFHPPKFKNTYRHWMENVKDWCISRQLWWGHRIPAFFYGEGAEDYVVAKTLEEAVEKAKEKSGKSDLTADDLKQEEDVLDTWFSSWLWPISVFDGFYSEDEVSYYYPTADLVTAPEIMFFWVARMIIAGYEYRGEKPFKNVYYTGIVRDKQGRKMSKSLGNSPDPIELMKEYGADGVRVGMLLTSPAGNDLPFDVKLCEQGRNFANKIWNAMRLVMGWEVADQAPTAVDRVSMDWMQSRIAQAIQEQDKSYGDFRISEVLMNTYRLIWDDYCSWYLEMIKPAYGQPISIETREKTLDFLEDLLKLLHPFMPFLSEDIWHRVRERGGKDDALIVAAWPEAGTKDDSLLKGFADFQEMVTAIRNIRKDNNIPFKEDLALSICKHGDLDDRFLPAVQKLGALSDISFVEEKVEQSFGFMVGAHEFFIPMGDTVDLEKEKVRIEEELDYTRGFLQSVQKKLANERFVNGAPEQVVANERKKEADALEKIKVLERDLEGMG